MSWRSDYQQLATPQCLRQFIKELIHTELISEQQKILISSTDIESKTLAECDPAVEMDFRHVEAKAINEAKLAQLKIPKQDLLKEARRIVSQEEIQEKYIKHQNAAYNRELRNFQDEMKKSNLDNNYRRRPAKPDPKRSSSAHKRVAKFSSPPEIIESAGRERRAKSTGEIELKLEQLKIFNQCDGKSDSASSTGSSDDSAVTILSRNDLCENVAKEKFSLPPLKIEVKETQKSPKILSPKLASISADNKCDRESLQKYWLIWRAVAFRQKNLKRLKKSSEDKQFQIENFLSQFENEQECFTIGSETFSSIENKRISTLSSGSNSKRTKSCSNLEQIIKDQKAKLREQEKLISKLKLEQIKLAAEKSQHSTQDHVEKSLQDSSLPVKRKLNYLRSSFPNILDKNYYDKPRPSFLVQMEKRQKERLERKKELRERTRLKIAEQKRLQKEKEEAKKLEIAEQKRLDHEMKLEQMRSEAEMRANEQAAAAFCRLRRMRLAFGLFRRLLEARRRRLLEAEAARETRLLEAAFVQWRLATRARVRVKIADARKHYKENLSRFVLNQWRAMALNAKRNRQVAEDYHDLMISERTFKCWRAETKNAFEKAQEKGDAADHHYDKCILRKCWKSWKSLHQILAEERKVEMKKESLRDAIRVILPDFRPTFVESVKTSNQL